MYIRVKVKPNARHELFNQESDSSFSIAVKQKAADNQANLRVLELLSNHFKVPSARLRIITGHRSPSKIIMMTPP